MSIGPRSLISATAELLYDYPFNGSSGVDPTPGKFNPAKGSGERCKLPQRVRAEPGCSTILHFGPKKASDESNFTCILTNTAHALIFRQLAVLTLYWLCVCAQAQ